MCCRGPQALPARHRQHSVFLCVASLLIIFLLSSALIRRQFAGACPSCSLGRFECRLLSASPPPLRAEQPSQPTAAFRGGGGLPAATVLRPRSAADERAPSESEQRPPLFWANGACARASSRHPGDGHKVRELPSAASAVLACRPRAAAALWRVSAHTVARRAPPNCMFPHRVAFRSQRRAACARRGESPFTCVTWRAFLVLPLRSCR